MFKKLFLFIILMLSIVACQKKEYEKLSPICPTAFQATVNRVHFCYFDNSTSIQNAFKYMLSERFKVDKVELDRYRIYNKDFPIKNILKLDIKEGVSEAFEGSNYKAHIRYDGTGIIEYSIEIAGLYKLIIMAENKKGELQATARYRYESMDKIANGEDNY